MYVWVGIALMLKDLLRNSIRNHVDMSKLVKDIQTNPKPMFYACVLEGLRKIALKCGYALAVHGTCASDLDLIAVRWSDTTSHLLI